MEAVGVFSPILYNSLSLLSVSGFSHCFHPQHYYLSDTAIMEFNVCWSELTSRHGVREDGWRAT